MRGDPARAMRGKARGSQGRASALRALAAGASLLALCGCGDGKTAAALIDAAVAHRAAEDFPAAAIELRNALRHEPKNIAAELLLAQTLLDLGDATAADRRIVKAVEDGAPPATSAGLRAKIDLQLAHYDEVILRTRSAPDGASIQVRATLLAARGEVQARLHRIYEARRAIADALNLDPDSEDAALARVRVEIIAGNLRDARQQLALALSGGRKTIALLTLQGDLATAARDYDEAERVYQGIVDAHGWDDPARVSLARAQIALGKIDAAVANLDPVLQRFPNDPPIIYLRGLAAYRAKDYAAARTYAERALHQVRDFPAAWLIAGASAYAQGDYQGATRYIEPFLQQFPENLLARRLLGATQMALGRPGRAVETLTPAVEASGEDPQTLALIGVAAARSGEFDLAYRYFGGAIKADPDNPNLRAALAGAEINLGKTEAGIVDLETAVAADPKDVRAALSLFITALRANDYDKALAVARQVQQAYPKDPGGFDLEGVALLTKGDVAPGKAALETALKLQPGDYNANRNLAKLALREGRIDDARRHYQAILKANPRSTRTAIELSELEDAAGNTAAAEAALGDALRVNPDDALAYAAIGRFHLFKGDYQAVLDAIGPALKRFPRDNLLLEETARAELALGQNGPAIETLTHLAELEPQVVWVHVLLSESFLATGQAKPAADAADDALHVDPQDKAARLALARAQMAQGAFGDAQKLISALEAGDPANVAAIELEGALARMQHRYDDAAAAFARAVKLYDNRGDRLRLAEMQAAAGKLDDAVATLQPIIDGRDHDAVRLLGNLYYQAGRLPAAIEQFARLVEADPKDARAENNLAFLLLQDNRTEEALAHARNAAALAPNAETYDTLGLALLRSGKASEAADAFAEAKERDPGREDLQLHLAQALARAGQADAALDLLHQLLALPRPFKERDAAQSLLRELGG
jgi:putative PEP-CTERM system TPR-repeat lipoprotein